MYKSKKGWKYHIRRLMFSLAVLLFTVSSVLSIYSNKAVLIPIVAKYVPGTFSPPKNLDSFWAKEILKGGYILHFRHAERDKWLDVHMYDVLETKFHKDGAHGTAFGERQFFKGAVCLNERGVVQAQAMQQIIKKIDLPISRVITSPSCRARQTANIAFGGFDSQNLLLLHEGAFNENIEEYRNKLKNYYQSLIISPDENIIISSHNSVINPEMFTNGSDFKPDYFYLEEGGFYVISQTEQGLKLEHKFYFFLDFVRQNFDR